MRRLVSILLALACCAFAQVPSWVVTNPAHQSCGCCDSDGSCGMPDCVPPPAAVPVFATESQPARIAGQTLRRVAQPARRTERKFFAVFVEPLAASAAVRPPVQAASPASVPLFRAHCSYLI